MQANKVHSEFASVVRKADTGMHFVVVGRPPIRSLDPSLEQMVLAWVLAVFVMALAATPAALPRCRFRFAFSPSVCLRRDLEGAAALPSWGSALVRLRARRDAGCLRRRGGESSGFDGDCFVQERARVSGGGS